MKNPTREKNPCPLCQGTGFKNGKLCTCITGAKIDGMPDLPDGWEDDLGAFSAINQKERGKCSG